MVSEPRTLYSSGGSTPSRSRPVSLVELIDRVLAGGVVVAAHVTLAVADVDLIDLDIALLIAATATVAR